MATGAVRTCFDDTAAVAQVPLTGRKRPRPGDVIEIDTPAGLAYAQYTHRHTDPPRYGALLRVLPGIFAERPGDFTELVRGGHRFLCFFPLGAACRRGIVRVVAEEAVPEAHRVFPTFRTGNPGPDGRVRVWFTWDGRETRRVRFRGPGFRRLPVMPGTWNDTALVDAIVNGYRPRLRDDGDPGRL